MRAFAIFFLTALTGISAQAEDGPVFFYGFGYEDVSDKHSGSPGGLLEYGSATFGTNHRFRYRMAAMASHDGDIWIGGGVSYQINLGESPWFTELSFVPGIFRRGNAGIGEEVVHLPQFRSQIAVGYEFGNGRSLALTFSHRSNGKLDGDGSSMETVLLRYGMAF